MPEALQGFLQESTKRLRSCIFKAPSQFRRQVPAFESVLDLAVLVEDPDQQHEDHAVLRTPLLCVAQLGHLICHLNHHPEALQYVKDNGPRVTGICIGLLAAAAVSSCTTLTEVIAIAGDIVQLSFQVGLEIFLRSKAIDRSPGSWSTVVSQISADDAQIAIDSFNAARGDLKSHWAYISAEGLNSITISGPPSTTKDLLESKKYAGNILSDVLLEILSDISQYPVSLKSLCNGLHKSMEDSQGAILHCFGPVTSAKAIKNQLHSLGFDLHDADKATPATKSTGNSTNDIAIVGMSARLPGSETLEELWKVLEDGRDLHEKIRPDRFDVNTHCDPTGKKDNTTLTPYGVFIDRPGYFDTRLFNMSPREAAQTDPQMRLALLTTYEALEMAGYAPNRSPATNTRRIGSFIGQTSDDYREVNASQKVDTYFITGGIRAFAPGRLNSECDMAIGGGVNFLTASDLFAGLSRGSFLSKTGGCKTFDDGADGYVRADAVGVVVLKRLDAAITDRDNILAVLKCAVTNHSAEAVSITHPHAETQQRLFNMALNKAGLSPDDIDYAELHGTGTQAGDATESRSVTNVLTRGRLPSNPLYIGTVKPNLGHGEAGSGVTSLIKAILMMRYNTIPPHVGIKGKINHRLPPLKELNTHISFDKTPFYAKTSGDGKRRILINNFDAAGGNTSMIIEDPPVLNVKGVDPRKHHIIAVSGKTARSALNNSRRLLEYIKSNPRARVEDIAYTTTARRMHHPIRQAHAVSSLDELIGALEKSIEDEPFSGPSSTPRPVVFMFTGQGSQYISMASELFETHATFRETLRRHSTFLPLITDTSVDIAEATPVQIHLAVVAVEIALAELWKSFGIEPSAVIGHSLGEYAALYTAGVLSLHDCLYLVGKRASFMMDKCTPGTHAMLAVRTSAEITASVLKEKQISCEISCFNGPVATVVSGRADQIDQLQQHFRSEAVKCTNIDVQFAFHSAQMDPFMKEYKMAAKNIHFAKPKIAVASTLLGEIITTSGVFCAEYLARQTREPVQFEQTLSALKEFNGHLNQGVWIETGPNPICLGLLRSNIGDGEVLLPSLKNNEPDWKIMSNSVARAYSVGLEIDWTEFHRPFESSLRLLELPSYAFDLKNYWIQYEGDWALRKGRLSKITCEEKSVTPPFSTTSLHRIEAQSKSDTAISVTFSSDASETKLNKVLRGHLVNGAGLCPSSVYADMAFTAAKYIGTLMGTELNFSMDVRDMTVHKPLLIKPGETKQIIRVQATKTATSDTVDVTFSSQDGQEVHDHAHCVVLLGGGEHWTSEWNRNAYLIQSRMDHLVSASFSGEVHRILRPMAYKLFAALVEYDEKYQGMEEVYMDSTYSEATANIKFRTTDEDGLFTYSPFWIDSFAHLSGFVLNGAETTPADSVFISHGWESMRIVGELSDKTRYRSYVRMQETTTGGVMAGDVYLFNAQARVVAVCQGLKFQRIKRSILNYLLPHPGAAAIRPAINAPSEPVNKTSPPPQPPVQTKYKASPPLRQSNNLQLQSSILDTIASEVGIDVKELTEDAVFSDLGIDSLLSISITDRLSQVLGRAVPVTLFHEVFLVKDLISYFIKIAPSEFDTSSSSSTGEAAGDEIDVFDTVGSDGQSDGDGIESPISPPEEEADDRLVDVLRKIIAREVGIDESEIDSETPFADLGVDSLLSLAILDAIKNQTGRIFPSNFLVDNPSLGAIESSLGGPAIRLSKQTPQLEHLEKALQQAQSQKAKAILLQGDPNASCPALFLLPDGSGSASSYINLPALNNPGPVYGLDSPFLSSPSSFRASLPEVAAVYIREIRRIQPHGPYRLGGWSIGGSYAFEATSQLITDFGEKVENLVLIDAPCPNRLPPLPVETVQVLESIGAFGGLRDHRSGAEIREGVKEHFAGSINALKAYTPRPLRCPEPDRLRVTILWARSGVWETVGPEVRARYEASAGGDNIAKDWMMDRRTDQGPGGWDALLPGAKVKCQVVTGDHFSIMRRPNILELGEKLRKAL
ncbi:Type I Iterative PKS [Cytospora paraplurivora]|uniref:Type I Iterative PKS n=1 Tax=Cytospora paraplurivora TaxID=2898453 RepID=A0AAN9UA27_9PEZI